MTTNQSSNLRPCPFCGGTNICTEKGINLNYCDSCSAEANIEHWNTRPIEDDLRKRIAELEEKQRWRVVADGELPEDGATVLAAFENREILTATYYKHHEGFGGVENYWHIEGWHSGNVTHWMPLPESPNDTQSSTFVYGKESEE